MMVLVFQLHSLVYCLLHNRKFIYNNLYIKLYFIFSILTNQIKNCKIIKYFIMFFYIIIE